jgi:hypothetical protein
VHNIPVPESPQLSLAKVIGPDIQELIRENPRPDRGGGGRTCIPADIASFSTSFPREDRLVLFEALPTETGRGGPLRAEGRDAPAHPAPRTPEKLGAYLDRVPATRSRSCSST